jgi:hypothetical protein
MPLNDCECRLGRLLPRGCKTDGQMASQVLLASLQRRAMMASALLTVQCMPDCLRRWPMRDMQLTSMTREPTNRPSGGPVVAYAAGVVLEVAERCRSRLSSRLRGVLTARVDDPVDVAVVEVLQPGSEPPRARPAECRRKTPRTGRYERPNGSHKLAIDNTNNRRGLMVTDEWSHCVMAARSTGMAVD